jgi:hypothetical protein
VSGRPTIDEVLRPLVHRLVATQEELDLRAHESVATFGETGVTPTGLAFERVRIALPVRLGVNSARLVAAPAVRSTGRLVVDFGLRAASLPDLVAAGEVA